MIVLVASSNDNQTGPTSDKLSSRTTCRRLRTERSKLLLMNVNLMNVNNYSMFLLLKFLLYEVLITIKRVQKKYEDIIINDLISMKENVNINL